MEVHPNIVLANDLILYIYLCHKSHWDNSLYGAIWLGSTVALYPYTIGEYT